MFGIAPELFFAFIGIFLFSISFHEFGHAYIATKLGDCTSKIEGRLTLNPIAHLDPMGTLFFVMTLLGGFPIGWAKPVPVNPYNFRDIDRKLGMALVAIAGPIFNIILAIFMATTLRLILSATGYDLNSVSDLISLNRNTPIWFTILISGITINILLASFNLIPIPPLDGSKILQGTVLSKADEFWHAMERYGPILLISLILLGDMSSSSFDPVSLFIQVVSLPFFRIVSFVSGFPFSL